MNNTRKPLIVAVDDRPDILTVISSALEEQYKVLCVTSGRAALNIIEKNTPDLFLLDIDMPVMDGYRLSQRIRRNKQFEKTPIIFLTGKDTQDDVVTAVRCGGNDYILKPVNVDLLHKKIRKFLN